MSDKASDILKTISSSFKNWVKINPGVFLEINKSIFSTVLETFNFSIFLIGYIKTKFFSNLLRLERAKNWLKKWLMWRRGVLFRPATHGGVVVLSLLVMLFGSIFGRTEIEAQSISPTEGGLLIAGVTSETIIPDNRVRSEIVSHTVVSGETLSSITKKYDVGVESIQWLNNIKDVNDIMPGELIRIPPVSGVIHKVKSGDTIESVAKKYQVSAQAIADYPFNYLDDSFTLKPGQELVVPDGVMPQAPKPKPALPPALAQGGSAKPEKVSASGRFFWPTSGSISQHFSWWHPADDINSFDSPPILASDSGTVVLVQYLRWGYGYHIIIDHGNSYQTLYAHLSKIYVSPGEKVSKGQTIGQMGSTGRSTGPHLHFEIRKNGTPVNPLSYF